MKTVVFVLGLLIMASAGDDGYNKGGILNCKDENDCANNAEHSA
jgi:hypothetical protein